MYPAAAGWHLYRNLKSLLHSAKVYLVPNPRVGLVSSGAKLAPLSQPRFLAGFHRILPWCQSREGFCNQQAGAGTFIATSPVSGAQASASRVFRGAKEAGAAGPARVLSVGLVYRTPTVQHACSDCCYVAALTSLALNQVSSV